MNKNARWMISMVMCFLLVGSAAYGTALTAERITPTRSGRKLSLTVKNDEVIYAGSMTSVDSTGEAVSSQNAASENVVGRSANSVDNADDGEVITVDVGIFGWEASGTITASSIGDIAYVIDDATVAITNPGNSCIAGIIIDVDDDYVWVDTFEVARTAGSFTTLAASGAATLSTTLEVTGATTLSSTLEVTGALTQTGAAALASTLSVAGALTQTAGLIQTPVLCTITDAAPTQTVAAVVYYQNNTTAATVAQKLANGTTGAYVEFWNTSSSNTVTYTTAGNMDVGGIVITNSLSDGIGFRNIGGDKWYRVWNIDN